MSEDDYKLKWILKNMKLPSGSSLPEGFIGEYTLHYVKETIRLVEEFDKAHMREGPHPLDE